MKAKIIIVVLVITNIVCLVFAYAQKVAANEQRELAIAAATEAQEQRTIAEQQAVLADHNAAQAMKAHEMALERLKEAEEALVKCK